MTVPPRADAGVEESDALAEKWSDEALDLWAKDSFRLVGHKNPSDDYLNALIIVYHKWKREQRRRGA